MAASGGDLPKKPPKEAVRQADGSYTLDLEDGSSVRWTKRPDGTWRRPERKRAGWVGALEQKKYVTRGAAQAETRQQRMVAEATGASRVGQVPGLAPEPQAKTRNERKKEQRREKAEAKETERVETAPSLSAAASQEAPAPEGPKSEKAIEKKLRQIAELEQRVAQGAKLNEDQAAKLAAKETLVEELSRLRLGDATSSAPDETPASSEASPPRAGGRAASAHSEEAVSVGGEAGPPKRKAIEKKLRQIAELEEKQREGKPLNEDQLSKLAGKAELQAALESCA